MVLECLGCRREIFILSDAGRSPPGISLERYHQASQPQQSLVLLPKRVPGSAT